MTDYYNFRHVLFGMNNLLRDHKDDPFRKNIYNEETTPVYYDIFQDIKKNGAINNYNFYQLKEDTLDLCFHDLSQNEKNIRNLHRYPKARLINNMDRFLDYISIAKKTVTQPWGRYTSRHHYHANSLNIIMDEFRLKESIPHILVLTSSALSPDEELVRQKSAAIDKKLGFLENSTFAPKQTNKKPVLYLRPEKYSFDNAEAMLTSMSRQFRLPRSLQDVPINL
ncbi:MAG TPA: hypothetical protein VGF14_08395 [Alphaproteobacteria bacterium]